MKALIIAIDKEKRMIKLSMKQLVPTDLDEYLADHKEGDAVTGRVVEVSGSVARVELGEGVIATCKLAAGLPAREENKPQGSADLSSLGSMLQARWKGTGPAENAGPEALQAGQVRSFRIAALDAAAKKIELQLA